MRYLFFLTILYTAFETSASDKQQNVDPGISVHNYKHANKAEKAKLDEGKTRLIEVTDANKPNKRNGNPTPKYVLQPANLVVTKTHKRENILINPLKNSANYKVSNKKN